MRVIVATDTRFFYENGSVFASEKMAKILPRYAHAFGRITLLARKYQAKPEAVLTDVSDMVEMPVLFGSFGELYSSSFRKKILVLIQKSDLVIGRFEGFAAILVYQFAQKLNKPFMGEVMSDPWDGLWNHSFLGKIAAPFSYFMTKRAMETADYGLYVTSSFLQNRYPCPKPTVAASNVYIKDCADDVLEKRIARIRCMDTTAITLMTTGATYVRYKGQEYVIRAIPELNRLGIKIKYYVVGEGSQDHLRNVAKKCRVENQVVFTGRMPLDEVMRLLDEVDIYVQPSLQEGLPRAVIEAMSRGCPCIGARTAGIPELLQPECVFKRKSSSTIVEAIVHIMDTDKMVEYAKQNFANSKNFLDDVLNQRRNAYYAYVIEDLADRENHKCTFC